MSEIGDRTVMTLIVTTGVLGLVGWIVAAGVYRPPAWVPWFAFPVLFAILVIVLVAVVWEGLDLMD